MIAHVLIRAELPRFPFFDVSKVSSKLTSLAFSFGGCKGRTTYLLDPLSKGYVGSLEKDARFSPISWCLLFLKDSSLCVLLQYGFPCLTP